MTLDNVAFLSAVVALLFGGNVYFIKRLVDKIESTAGAQTKQNESLVKVHQDLNAIGGQLRDLKIDMKELRRVEIEFAVLKSKLESSFSKGGV